MEKLTRSGKAILCTIHQPSAMLSQRFDRLLLLAKGGKTVYFGEIGENSRSLMNYFSWNGGVALPEGTNPAEHMLNVIGAAPGADTDIDWPRVWRQSPEYQGVQDELAGLSRPNVKDAPSESHSNDLSQYREFASPVYSQLLEVTKRVFEQIWRSPQYIYSKFALSVGTVSLPNWFGRASGRRRLTMIGFIHRSLRLEERELNPRSSKPNVWCFPVSDHFQSNYRPNDALFRGAAEAL